MYGGTCSEYELPGNEAWCEGYGDHGEEGQTPNENCCFCQGKVSMHKISKNVWFCCLANKVFFFCLQKPSENEQCFGADDGGTGGILYQAVRDYAEQDCANKNNCAVGQTYGWPMNSWCVGSVTDMSNLFEGMSTFNENISGWDTSSVTTMNRMFYGATSFNGNFSSWNTKTAIIIGKCLLCMY